MARRTVAMRRARGESSGSSGMDESFCGPGSAGQSRRVLACLATNAASCYRCRMLVPQTELTDASASQVTRVLASVLPPDVLGAKRYAIGEMIARAGMGAILDAREGAAKRNVAMKVMLNS